MSKYPQSKLNRVKRGQPRANYDVETIHQIIADGYLCYVGYIHDNQTITIPMAYAFVNDKLYLHGSTGNRMLKSIVKQKETSITIMHLKGLVLARSGLHHSVNYESAILFGTCNLIDDDTQKTEILGWVVDQMVPNRWETLRTITKAELDRTLVVEFIINTASAKIRNEGVNDEPEDYETDVWAGVIPIKQIALQPIADQGKPQKMPLPKHITDFYEKNS